MTTLVEIKIKIYQMKTIKLVLAIIILFISFTSCSDDNNDAINIDENPLADYTMLTSFKANSHTIELYSEQEQLTIGYNELFIRIKDDATESYISGAEISWNPVMHMTAMMHSCPNSAVSKTDHNTVYNGYIVFQMPSNTEEYWDLTLNYVYNNQSYTVTEQIEVKSPVDDKQRVTVFTGSDDVRYVLAMMPISPKVAVNDFSAMLFKMESMMSFPAVENYEILIDPRMPSMGNHSSPNNEDLSYDATAKMYTGKLSLTMTGYWKLNLKVLNEIGELTKGETITDEIENSSLYFEIEF
mgnify:FL=1|tara:strand:- start:14214 stop:15107 length:894 start_codon:yes stop_codon:yes gene_type:complete